jgi:hypothetical protein
MKRVLVHWVQMEIWEVPDECPTEDEMEFTAWLVQNDPENELRVKSSSRDYEIVETEQL